MIGAASHAGSMFWILQPAKHNDYDGYSIYTDPARYPHDPKPIQPIPSPTVCSGGNATDVRPNCPSVTRPSHAPRHKVTMPSFDYSVLLSCCKSTQMTTRAREALHGSWPG